MVYDRLLIFDFGEILKLALVRGVTFVVLMFRCIWVRVSGLDVWCLFMLLFVSY